jgi:glucose/arabinose dehydrogenase
VAGATGERTGALRIVRVAGGFDDPVYMTAPASQPNRLYVVEQAGRVLVVANGRRLARPFLDIRSLVGSDGSEQGLLSLAFHPQYEKNGRFYVDYTDRQGNTRVVEYRVRSGRVLTGSPRRLLLVPQPYSNHNGGQLQFGPDRKLYVGMGDGGSAGDPRNNGQTPRSRLAKLLRTDPLKVRWDVTGYGLRNPWRFSFDRATGDLYIGDVGQNEIEEIDYRRRGAPAANYGWARYEGSSMYKNVPLDPAEPLVFPVHEYSHAEGCSVTGGYVYRGKAVSAATGRYFFGDYCQGTVWSLRIVDGKATDVRREPFEVSGIASFGENPRGELYLVSHLGTIYRLAG